MVTRTTMANSDALATLHHQAQQLQQELPPEQQQEYRNTSANEAVPTCSAENVKAPTETTPSLLHGVLLSRFRRFG